MKLTVENLERVVDDNQGITPNKMAELMDTTEDEIWPLMNKSRRIYESRPNKFYCKYKFLV